MYKMWGARFSGELDKKVREFTESFSFDRILWKYDIQTAIAHTQMLHKIKIITKKEKETLISALKEIKKEIETKGFGDSSSEDIHSFIEEQLFRKVGKLAGKLHTARSRNDLIAHQMRMYTKDMIRSHLKSLNEIQNRLLKKAETHIDIIIPGMTHLQSAQPISASFYFLCYMEKFKRDIERLKDVYKRTDILVLGSCALAGSTIEIDRKYLKTALGFKEISHNAMDGVSDRDFIVEYISACSQLAVHISNFSEDMIIYNSVPFSLIKIDDRFTTGSSIMPQKKNPDVFELLRGKTSKFISYLTGILTLLKGLPMAYNRDLQEDKHYLFTTAKEISSILDIFSSITVGIEFNENVAKTLIKKGYLETTAMAEYLVKKGVPFREAHNICGKVVNYAESKNLHLSEIPLETLKSFSSSFDKDVFKVLNASELIGVMNSSGGTGKKVIKKELKRWKRFVNKKDFL